MNIQTKINQGRLDTIALMLSSISHQLEEINPITNGGFDKMREGKVALTKAYLCFRDAAAYESSHIDVPDY